MACTRESGTCDYCRAGCAHKPGWFLPGEAEKAAEFMDMSLPDFFAAYLAVDWWEGDHRMPTTFVLSPAIVGEGRGTEFPGEPRGTCVFYKDARCQIHPAKPAECRVRWCGDKEAPSIHEDVARAWADDQEQITALLGREPEAEEYEGGIFGLLGSMFGGL